MADRFWKGGNWSDTANWSATNNGAGGVSVPGSSDNVYWHTVPVSSTYTLDVTASCLDMDWTGATNNPIFVQNILNIFGSLTNIIGMTWSGSGDVNYKATSTGKTITTAGRTFATTFNLNGVGGGWTLQDNLTCTQTVTVTNGSFDFTGRTITALSFDSNNSNLRTINLTNATVNVTLGWNVATSTNLTLTATGSTININGTSTFAGGGKTYGDVNLTTGTVTISGNNTYTLLTPTIGITVILTAGSNQTATTNFVFKNITIRTTSAGVAATLTKATGVVVFRNCSIKDITGVGSFSAIRSSTNVSGNTGITFGSYVVVEKQLDGRKYALNASGVLTAL